MISDNDLVIICSRKIREIFNEAQYPLSEQSLLFFSCKLAHDIQSNSFIEKLNKIVGTREELKNINENLRSK